MGILANELRIGNWVSQKYAEYDLANNSKGYYFSNNQIRFEDLKWCEDYPDNYNPIPLTPEILEKCGFEKQNNGWNINKKWELDDTCFSLFDNNYCKGKLKLTYNVGNGPTPKVKYLHQLQNLYFALCGVELEVKL